MNIVNIYHQIWIFKGLPRLLASYIKPQLIKKEVKVPTSPNNKMYFPFFTKTLLCNLYPCAKIIGGNSTENTITSSNFTWIQKELRYRYRYLGSPVKGSIRWRCPRLLRLLSCEWENVCLKGNLKEAGMLRDRELWSLCRWEHCPSPIPTFG